MCQSLVYFLLFPDFPKLSSFVNCKLSYAWRNSLYVHHRCSLCFNSYQPLLPLTILKKALFKRAEMWPSMHKPTIHHIHSLTELLVIMMVFFFYPYDLLFLSYTMVSVIRLKMYISRSVRFQFRIPTLFTNSPRTDRFVFNKYIQSSWTKLCQVRSRG